jgi:hypothetical protein
LENAKRKDYLGDLDIERWCEDVHWNHLDQDRVQLRALVNVKTKPAVPYRDGMELASDIHSSSTTPENDFLTNVSYLIHRSPELMKW